MKNKFKLGLVLFSVCGVFVTAPGSFAADAAADAVAIPCIDNGKVVNASEDEVCKAVLPQCSALKSDVEAKVKDLLSWKIWGYYNGKDIDLNKSGNVEGKVTLEGTDMANPICSVVGQKMKFTGSTDDFEITNQSIADKKSCGVRPNVFANKRNKVFKLKYEKENGGGSLWIAYMQGAYPWLIRRNAYDVLSAIKPDLSNFSEVIKTEQMSKDIQDTVTKMKTFSKSLSKEAKASCNLDSKQANLIDQCKSGSLSVTDPVQRVCTLVKAQLAANEGALPNMLVYEIMQNRVYKQYDSLFGNLLNSNNPVMRSFGEECADTGGFLNLNRKKKIAKTASCYFGGEYCANDDDNGNAIHEAPAGGTCVKNNTFVNLQSGDPVKDTGVFGQHLKLKGVTSNPGFASVVERLIRHDVCGQNQNTDDSICDKVAISSKPAGIP